MIRLRKVCLNGHIARMGEQKLYEIYAKNLKGRYILGDLNVDGRIILKCALNKEGVIMRIGFSWCRTQANGGLLQTRY